jgi:hypothetical protein
MSEESLNRPFVFSVVEDDGDNVTIEISVEDYQRDLAAGPLQIQARRLSDSSSRVEDRREEAGVSN